MMQGYWIKTKTVLALGVFNLIRVAVYRLQLRLPWGRIRCLSADAPVGEFFTQQGMQRVASPARVSLTYWRNEVRLFSYLPYRLDGNVPDWLRNPLTGQSAAGLAQKPWWQIPDFNLKVGDIKLLWELSRMDWLLAMASRAAAGDADEWQRLNAWLADWCRLNPPYYGPNWKCGQEASIRVMHVAMAAIILGQVRDTAVPLLDFVKMHLQRIAPTVHYAMAQDNNHGTSEAAALFIGGSWLVAQGRPEGETWQRMGRRWLENRAQRLIGPQGSFSQHSLNYHRVMLDTYSIAEVWRRQLGLMEFSDTCKARLRSATLWLHHMVDVEAGDAPNLGANDGARLLQLADTEYRDQRPSVQMAAVLFCDAMAYAEEGAWNQALQWLGIPLPQKVLPPAGSLLADDGGFAMLRRQDAFVLFRYPRFHFRPSQSDALHVDVWLGGKNVMRDGGTYSYNTDPQWLQYFGGTASHNTVQFDGRDQMPRLGRFLFGNWLKTRGLKPLVVGDQETSIAAGYQDGWGAEHRRKIRLQNNCLLVEDQIAGRFHKAVLRWRLMPGQWVCHDGKVEGQGIVLSVQADIQIVRFEIVEGFESRHYMEKTPLPVLEVELAQPGRVVSHIQWKA